MICDRAELLAIAGAARVRPIFSPGPRPSPRRVPVQPATWTGLAWWVELESIRAPAWKQARVLSEQVSRSRFWWTSTPRKIRHHQTSGGGRRLREAHTVRGRAALPLPARNPVRYLGGPGRRKSTMIFLAQAGVGRHS